jgi:hypothetical protein
MASELRVNTLKDAAGNNSVGMSYVANGSAKVWVNFTGITTTASRDSFNVSSLTDDGTGRTTIAISSNMANGNYTGSWFQNGTHLGAYDNFGNDFTGNFGPRAAGSYSVYAFGSSAVDAFYHDSTVFGELA